MVSTIHPKTIRLDATAPDAVNVPNNTWTKVAELTMTPGIWLVLYGGAFTSNSSGYRRIHFGTNSNSGRTSPTAAPVNGEQTRMMGSVIHTFTSDSTYNLYAHQTSGSQLQFYAWIQAVKLA